jgi:hypothetical protein
MYESGKQAHTEGAIKMAATRPVFTQLTWPKKTDIAVMPSHEASLACHATPMFDPTAASSSGLTSPAPAPAPAPASTSLLKASQLWGCALAHWV